MRGQGRVGEWKFTQHTLYDAKVRERRGEFGLYETADKGVPK